MPGVLDLKAKWATDLGLGGNPTAQFGAPVSFTSHLASITPGQTQVLGTSGLANGYRTPYVIDEIRMQGYMTSEATIASGHVLQPSYALKFQFRTGTYAFSNVPVPMILHTPRYTVTQTTGVGIIDARGPMLVSAYTGAPVPFRLGEEARWVLAKPLWMGPGDQIQALVQRDPSAASNGNGAFAVDVTYVGRSLKPGTRGPKCRYVPWAAHYIHDFADSFSQTTTEFRNPFTFPLQIQKLIGRPLSKATNDQFRTSGGILTLPNDTDVTKYATIYIEDSLGYKVTNGFLPAGNVFDSERCAWTFSRPMGPREQLNMQFRTVGTTFFDDTSPLLGVSMLGYREEQA